MFSCDNGNLLAVACGSRLAAAVIGTAAGSVAGGFGIRGGVLGHRLGLLRRGVLGLGTGLAAAVAGTGRLRLRNFGGLRLLVHRVVHDRFRAVAEANGLQNGLFLRLLPRERGQFLVGEEPRARGEEDGLKVRLSKSV